MKEQNKTYLFEEMPISKAVMQLSIPTVLGCLVMILYNLADTYFVGMLLSYSAIFLDKGLSNMI